MNLSIREWLEHLGLLQYTQAFDENDIDVDVLPQLTDQILKDIGVASVGHRLRILGAVSRLVAETSPDVENPPPNQDLRRGSSSSEAERRQITVLFCDLVASTELSQRLDPEHYREVVRDYQSACEAIVRRYEGHVAQYLGDGLLVYFGYPKAHEDDAQRAVQTGLDIIDAVSQLRPVSGPLSVRVGIHTGLVVVGEVGTGPSQEQLALGQTPNLAARLQGIAEPGTVVLSQHTRQLAAYRFDYRDMGLQTLKGIAGEVQVWRALAERRADSRFDAVRGGTSIGTLVGREEELQFLLRSWEQSNQGQGKVVLLVGEPGIGKSRLVRALQETLRDQTHTRLHYQCSPFHVNSAFAPVVDYLERTAGFSRGQSAQAKLDLLESALAQVGADVLQAAPLFADMLSLPVDRYPALKLSPQQKKEKTQAALLGHIETLATSQPLLLVFEDLHWIDPSTREVLDLLIQRFPRLRATAVLTCRPEFVSTWTESGTVTTMTLSRLDAGDAIKLVDEVAEGRALPREVVDGILSKTDGIPLFVEELTRFVLETGLVRLRGDRYDLAAPLSTLAVPTTLQDSLMARLDRLAPVKEVAQIGACVGREFSHDLLSSVSPIKGKQLDDALTQLVASGLVYPRRGTGDRSYVFKHALVRDAAYDSLLRSRRAQIHSAIAGAIASQFPALVESTPEVIAHHLTESGRTADAVPLWLAAGKRSLDRMALPEAISHLTTALSSNAALPAGEHRDHHELDIRMALGTAYFALLGWVAIEVVQTLEPARVLAEKLNENEKLVRILYYIWFHSGMRGQYAKSLDIAHALGVNARATGDSRALTTALMTDACARSWTGDFLGARAVGSELLAMYDLQRDGQLVHLYNHDPKCLTLVWAGVWLWALGWPDQARQACIDQLEHARRIGHPFNLIWGLSGGSMGLLLRRETETIWRWLQELATVGREQAMPIADLLNNWWGAYARIVDGKYQQGYELLAASAGLWEGIGALHLVPYAHINRAVALSAMGREEEALGRTEEALRIIEETNHRMHEAEVHRTRALVLLRMGREALAERCLEAGLDVARRQSAKGWELRAATTLCALWGRQGKREQALRLLTSVYDWFSEGLDTKDMQEAHALLEELRRR